MKFTSLLKNLVLEQSRFEILRDALTKPTVDKNGNKVKPKLKLSEFLQLIQGDPTTKLNNVDPETNDPKELSKIKAGKYVNWLIKHYLSPVTETSPEDTGYEREVRQMKDRFIEDLYKVTEDLKKFDRFKGRLPEEARDINKLTPSQLYNYVKDFDLTIATTTKSERKSAKVHPGSELLYDGPNWRVVKIEDKGALGKEAACFYGGQNKETRWCTSAPGLKYFESHIKDGPLYVVYNPNDPNVRPETGLPVERYQFHFPSNQFMDKDDQKIDLVQYLNGPMKELKGVFKSEFAKGITTDGGERFFVDNFSTGAIGKFISLYGLDDLIDNLPETLREFQIVNKASNDLIIKIPESIGRFKELRMVLLDNCVESIPDSICQLKKITFLALRNNPKLTTLPECISDLPNLTFLNLAGSSNAVAPKGIRERGIDVGGMWDLTQ